MEPSTKKHLRIRSRPRAAAAHHALPSSSTKQKEQDANRSPDATGGSVRGVEKKCGPTGGPYVATRPPRGWRPGNECGVTAARSYRARTGKGKARARRPQVPNPEQTTTTTRRNLPLAWRLPPKARFRDATRQLAFSDAAATTAPCGRAHVKKSEQTESKSNRGNRGGSQSKRQSPRARLGDGAHAGAGEPEA